MSALNGDNVVELSKVCKWYGGPTLLEHLETVHIASDRNLNTFRFPVQWVNRPNNPTDRELHDFRGLSGQIASGIVRKGQEVVVLPAGIKTTVKDIWTCDGSLDEAFCPQSVTVCLVHDIDISRGDMLVGVENLPGHSADLHAQICWMHSRQLQPGKKYFLKMCIRDRARRSSSARPAARTVARGLIWRRSRSSAKHRDAIKSGSAEMLPAHALIASGKMLSKTRTSKTN